MFPTLFMILNLFIFPGGKQIKCSCSDLNFSLYFFDCVHFFSFALFKNDAIIKTQMYQHIFRLQRF